MSPVYSVEYSIPYLLMSFIFLFLSYYEYRQGTNKSVRLICIVFFVLFYGLRGFVGWDWQGYYPSFELIDTLRDISIDSFFIITTTGVEFDAVEPGYILYQSVVKTIFNNWYFFVFISTCIDVWVFDKFFSRYSFNYAFSFFVFIAIHSALELDLLRNVKALLVFILSIDSICRKKCMNLLLLTFVGLSFHRSYLLYVVFYFIGFKNFGLKFWWVIFVVVNFIYLLGLPVVSSLIFPLVSSLGGTISDKVDAYAASDVFSMSRGFTFGYFMRAFLFLLVACKYDKIISDDRNVIIVNIFFAYIVASLGMTDMRIVADRMEYSLGFILWVILPLLLHVYFRNANRVIILSLILFFCFFKLVSVSSNAMWKYENVLLGAVDYEHRLITHRAVAVEIFNNN